MTVISDTAIVHHWIGGRPDTTPAGRYGVVTESATGDVTARVPLDTAAVVDRAVAAAAAAAERWGRSSISERTKVLFAFRQRVDAHREELAEIITREHGKVLSDALAEVQRGLEVVEFACGIGELLKGDVSAQVSRGVDSYTLRRPLGVVAGITPFNFPIMVRCGCIRSPSRAATRSSSSRPSSTRRSRFASPSCGRRPGSPTAPSTSSKG